ncbi:DUF421 domain-containing protein [Streptomyces sp. NPDC060286]|uniref:DUF421 domain-containing protein n=1 Tax=unclassified Streptomyces TaxID=2593676 RepID=UPI0035D87E84
MWHDLLSVQVPIAEKVLRTVGVYALIVILFRLSGKRGLANLNTFDFVVIFLLSNVVQNAVIGNDNSLLGGAIGATTLVAVNAALNRWLAVNERAVRLVEGKADNNHRGRPTAHGCAQAWRCAPQKSSTRCVCRTATTSAWSPWGALSRTANW